MDPGQGKPASIVCWAAFAADGKLDVDSFDGGHRWNGAKAYPLLASVLG